MAPRTEKPAATAATRTRPAPGAVETAVAAASRARPAAPSRDEAVRLLAYSYYQERGGVDGHDLDDWLRAEAALGSTGAET